MFTNAKRVWAFYLVLMLVCIHTPTWALTVALPDTQASPGGVLVVPVVVKDAFELAGVKLEIKYNANLLTVKDINTGPDAAGFIFADSLIADKIILTMAHATGITKSRGILAELVFQISASALPGTVSGLVFETVQLYNANTEALTVTIISGMVTVTKIQKLSVLPNPFTPNGDGYNDYVEFLIPDVNTHSIDVFIFSMSGRRVRRITNLAGNSLIWNGLDEGRNTLEPGTFIYLIKSDSDHIAEGTITLMR
ncbi:gliding motility-associated C-terminal domain-containing protein [candidate division KSB1 bacterium]|nr:gliding motility-associated C-terminal domain-containing protein [candidate division KSB1 bacterium]